MVEVGAPGAPITQCDWAGAVRGLSPRSLSLRLLSQEDGALGSLFPRLSPLLLPTGPRCPTLCGPCWAFVHDCCSLSFPLTSCHPVSSPPDSLHLSTTHRLGGKQQGVLCQAFVIPSVSTQGSFLE